MVKRVPLADINLTNTEVIGLVAAVVGTLAGSVTYLFYQYIAQLKSELAAWQRLAAGAVKSEEMVVHHGLRAKGIEPLEKIAPVMAQHNSPTTAAQQKRADLETLTAQHAANVLAAQQLITDEDRAAVETPALPIPSGKLKVEGVIETVDGTLPVVIEGEIKHEEKA